MNDLLGTGMQANDLNQNERAGLAQMLVTAQS